MRVELEWVEGVWVGVTTDDPRCFVWGSSISQTANRLRAARRAAAHDDAPLDVVPMLPPALDTHVADVREARHALRRATRALTAAGLSQRDVGTLLGVSHQRVQQLLDGR